MRKVRISTISFNGCGHPDKSRKVLEDLLECASFSKPDLIVLPETWVTLGMKEATKFSEPVPGPTTRALAVKAHEYHTYIICPLYQLGPDSSVYNSAILIGPEGEIIGEYHKRHPTISEIEEGVKPGKDTPVFKTKFGKIGMAICYDLNFRDVAEGLARGGVEIIFFPSAYEGGLQLQIWAFDFGVYVVSSHVGGYSTFVDVSGKIIARSDPNYSPVLTEEINLDRKILHLDHNFEKLDKVRKRYGKEVKIDIFRPEAVFALESLMSEVGVNDIVKEFGLEYRGDYFTRAKRVYQKTLEK